jgi:glycosyltransferase involved in cell wall biosynthesis
VRPAYSAIDTLLHPSTTESFPLALLEAMACGCRVIASAVGGVPEVISDPICGDLLHGRDPLAWAEAMGRHLGIPPCTRGRLAGEIRDFVARAHDQRVRFQHLEQVLRGGPPPTSTPP